MGYEAPARPPDVKIVRSEQGVIEWRHIGYVVMTTCGALGLADV
jgi:hypothetical protein